VACERSYSKYVKKGIVPRSKASARGSNSARRSSSNLDNSDADEDGSYINEHENEAVVAASEPSLAAPDPSPAAPPLDDVLPPVISSSVALTYYPPPLLPRNQRRVFSSSGARRDEKLIANFVCGNCCKMLFRVQVLRPCGCCVFCEECVPPVDNRTSACSTYSTPFEQALPYRTGNNIAEQMVRASFVPTEVADEWRNRGAEYARERGNHN
jgi:hypothetical protein